MNACPISSLSSGVDRLFQIRSHGLACSYLFHDGSPSSLSQKRTCPLLRQARLCHSRSYEILIILADEGLTMKMAACKMANRKGTEDRSGDQVTHQVNTNVQRRLFSPFIPANVFALSSSSETSTSRTLNMLIFHTLLYLDNKFNDT